MLAFGTAARPVPCVGWSRRTTRQQLRQLGAFRRDELAFNAGSPAMDGRVRQFGKELPALMTCSRGCGLSLATEIVPKAANCGCYPHKAKRVALFLVGE